MTRLISLIIFNHTYNHILGRQWEIFTTPGTNLRAIIQQLRIFLVAGSSFTIVHYRVNLILFHRPGGATRRCKAWLK